MIKWHHKHYNILIQTWSWWWRRPHPKCVGLTIKSSFICVAGVLSSIFKPKQLYHLPTLNWLPPFPHSARVPFWSRLRGERWGHGGRRGGGGWSWRGWPHASLSNSFSLPDPWRELHPRLAPNFTCGAEEGAAQISACFTGQHQHNTQVHQANLNIHLMQVSSVLRSLFRQCVVFQGCRSVEEFQCLNRIEEGTYGVVYRAKDKKTGMKMDM